MLWIIATTSSGQYILTCWLFVHHSNFSPHFFSWSNTPRKQRAFYATVMSATSALDEREESDAALLSDPNELLSKMEAYDIDIFNSCPPVQSFDEAVLFSSDIQSFQDEDYDEECQRHESTTFNTAFNRHITKFAVQDLEEQEARVQEVKETRESLAAALNGIVQSKMERLEREQEENSPTKRQRVEEGLVVAEQEGVGVIAEQKVKRIKGYNRKQRTHRQRRDAQR